jgi:hypothetical protein
MKSHPGEQPDTEHPYGTPQRDLAIDPQQLADALKDVI